MGHYRRRVLAATSAALFSGCLLDAETDRPGVRLFNHDTERHDPLGRIPRIGGRRAGPGGYCVTRPDSETVVDTRLELDRYEGQELVVEARIDDGEVTENSIPGGFTELHVAITDDETISLGGAVP